MHRSLVRFLLILLLGSLFTFGLAACGDDDGGPAGGDDDAGPDGGPDDGMDSGTDAGPEEDSGPDTTEDSGPMTTEDAGPLYQCEPPEPPTGGDVAEGEACCDGLGTCMEAEEGNDAQGVGDCDVSENLRCIANPVADADAGADDDAGAGGLLASCRMTLGDDDADDYEGRCVPDCLVRGASSSLSQNDCESGEICVPCYNPITGDDTGTCRNGGDAPVDPAPEGFTECGDGAGLCVPATAAGDTDLPQLECADGEACAPRSVVLDQDSCFERCSSGLGDGACVPAYIIPENVRAIVPQATCPEAHVCAPCVSPMDGSRTGACD